MARLPRARRDQPRQAGSASVIARVSHELRTPLHAILSLSQLMLDEVVGPLSVEQRKYLEVIDRNGQNLLRLTGDLLDLSRIQAGALTVDCGAVHVPGVVGAVAHALSPLAIAKGLALVIDAPADLPAALGDGARVEQVLTNLIGNAIKFTVRGSVRVEARGDRQAGRVRIDVVDTGIGIDAAARARIFDAFFQADSAGPQRGFGLGLALARDLVHLMAGTLTVESAPGAGARFSVSLPIGGGEGGRGAHPAG